MILLATLGHIKCTWLHVIQCDIKLSYKAVVQHIPVPDMHLHAHACHILKTQTCTFALNKALHNIYMLNTPIQQIKINKPNLQSTTWMLKNQMRPDTHFRVRNKILHPTWEIYGENLRQFLLSTVSFRYNEQQRTLLATSAPSSFAGNHGHLILIFMRAGGGVEGWQWKML